MQKSKKTPSSRFVVEHKLAFFLDYEPHQLHLSSSPFKSSLAPKDPIPTLGWAPRPVVFKKVATTRLHPTTTGPSLALGKPSTATWDLVAKELAPELSMAGSPAHGTRNHRDLLQRPRKDQHIESPEEGLNQAAEKILLKKRSESKFANQTHKQHSPFDKQKNS